MASASSISVWIIEDDALLRDVLTDLIRETPDLRAARTFGACEPALDALDAGPPPDVLLTDIGLPGLSGTAGVRQIKARAPDVQVLMLTVHDDEDTIFEALCAGASGYLLKNASSARIVAALREVHRGGVPFTPSVARKALHFFQRQDAPEDYGLTPREKDVLRCAAEGCTQKQTAARLHVSPHTVDTHLRNIYAKLHVHNGLAAVAKAIRERLI